MQEGRPSDVLAAELWSAEGPRLRGGPRPSRPMLVLLAGVPLSGKSTVARALAAAASTAALHIENDALRARIAALRGKLQPTHDPTENYLTYRAAWDLAGRCLAVGASAVHDATNLGEPERRPAYRLADAAGAGVVVLIVRTDEAVLRERAAREPPERRAAYRKLGGRAPRPSASRPFLVVDGARPVEEALARLRAAPELAPLFEDKNKDGGGSAGAGPSPGSST